MTNTLNLSQGVYFIQLWTHPEGRWFNPNSYQDCQGEAEMLPFLYNIDDETDLLLL